MKNTHPVVIKIFLLLSVFLTTDTLCQWQNSWKKLPGPFSGNITVHQFEYGNRIFVTGSYTSSTSDGGETWSDVIVNGYQIAFLFMTHEDGKLFGAGKQGAYVSLDSGNTWLTASNGLPTDQYSQYTISCGVKTLTSIMLGTRFNPTIGSGGIVSSTDFSTTWKVVPFHVSLEGVKAFGMYKSVVYTTNGSDITRRSTDMNDWDPPLKIPNSGSANCFKEHSGVFFAGATNGLFKLADDGNSWLRVSIGSPTLEVRDIYSDGQDVYVATNEGIYLSTDSATTWEKDITLPTNTNLYTIFSTKDFLFAGGFDNGVLFCKNKVTSKWTNNTKFSSYPYIRVVGSFYNKLLAATETDLFSSSDQGYSWKKLEWAGFPSSFGKVLQVGNTLVVGYNKGVVMTNDTGKSWQYNFESYITPQTLVYLKSKLFAFSGASVLSSADTGRSWKTYSYGLSDASIQSIGEFGDSLLLIGTNKSFYSTDTGASWHQANFLAGKNMSVSKVENYVIYFSDTQIDEFNIIRRGSSEIEKPYLLNRPYYHGHTGGKLLCSDSVVVYLSQSEFFISFNRGLDWTRMGPSSIYANGWLFNMTIINSVMYFASPDGIWSLNMPTFSNVNDKSAISVFNGRISPNPATSTVKINVDVDKACDVECFVYDVKGEQRTAFFSGYLNSGHNELTANLSNLPSGAYFCIIRSKYGMTSLPFILSNEN